MGSFGDVPDLTNRQILLRRRPTGLVQPGDTELVTSPAPEPAEGEALVRTTYVGLDAAVRTWLDDQPGYLPPVQLGEVIRAAGIGEVVAIALRRLRRRRRRHHADGLPGVRDRSRRRVQHAHPRRGHGRPAGGDVGVWPDRCHRLLRDDRTSAGRSPGRRWWCRPPRAPPGRWPGRSPRSPAPAWWASPAARRSAGRWSRTSGSTRASTTRTTTWPRRSNSTARAGSTSTSTTSAARSSTRCWAGWPPRRGSCSAASSPAT